jgi:hypothetical protein
MLARPDNGMSAPSSDSAAIRQTLRALKAAGVTPTYVEYGGGDGEDVTGKGEQAILDAIMAVDDAYLIVDLPENLQPETHPGHTPEGKTSHLYFVLGNEPFEVICDYGVSLEPVLGPLTEGWDE